MSQDITSIIGIINLYALAVDTQRWDLFDRIFTADVVADFGGPSPWQDVASFKRDFAMVHDPFDSTQHFMTNHCVEVKGDTAHAFTYGRWMLFRKVEGGGPLWDGQGWYDDEVIRTKDGWRIKKRVCRIVWWTGNPRVNETIPGVRVDMPISVLRREAAAGNVAFIKAIAGK